VSVLSVRVGHNARSKSGILLFVNHSAQTARMPGHGPDTARTAKNGARTARTLTDDRPFHQPYPILQFKENTQPSLVLGRLFVFV